LRSAWFLMAESGRILLEAVPKGLDVGALQADLIAAVAGVEDIHHVHAWCLTETRPMLTLHARIAPDASFADAARISAAIKQRLRARHGISHATVEIECERCADA